MGRSCHLVPRALEVAILVGLCSVACGGGAITPVKAGTDDGLNVPIRGLPDHVQPLRYDLELAISPERDRFSGRVEISVDIKTPTRRIWLHALELGIDSALVRYGGGQQRARPQAFPGGLLALDVPVAITGRTAILLRFRGQQGRRVGLFRQQFRQTWFSFSDFQPADARRAFPCFDEPRWKTPWSVSVVAPAGSTAYGNAPRQSRTAAGAGRFRYQFHQTRPLPTYLVAVAVGPFREVEVTGTEVPTRLLVPPGREGDTRYAKTVIPRYLAWLTRKLGQSVPARKIDWVAVPRMNGAMENHGLVTVGASILLFDDQRQGVEQRAFTSMVIAHELAHLWFGNLVTPRNWRELWVSEGFASWIADEVVAAMDPSLQPRGKRDGQRHDVLLADLDATRRPLAFEPESLEEMSELFTLITYKKGPEVVELLRRSAGPDVFWRALRLYLEKYKNGTAGRRELVQVFAGLGKQVGEVVTGYTDQVGFPALIVGEDSCSRTDRIPVEGQAPLVGPSTNKWAIPECVRMHQPYAVFAADVQRLLALASTPTGRKHPQSILSSVLVHTKRGALHPEHALQVVAALFESPPAPQRVREQLAIALGELGRYVEAGAETDFAAFVRSRLGGLGDPDTLTNRFDADDLVRTLGTWGRAAPATSTARELSQRALAGNPTDDHLTRAALDVIAWDAPPSFVDEMMKVIRGRPDAAVSAAYALSAVGDPDTARAAFAAVEKKFVFLWLSLVLNMADNPRVADVALDAVASRPDDVGDTGAAMAEMFARGLCTKKAAARAAAVLGKHFTNAHRRRIERCGGQKKVTGQAIRLLLAKSAGRLPTAD